MMQILTGPSWYYWFRGNEILGRLHTIDCNFTVTSGVFVGGDIVKTELITLLNADSSTYCVHPNRYMTVSLITVMITKRVDDHQAALTLNRIIRGLLLVMVILMPQKLWVFFLYSCSRVIFVRVVLWVEVLKSSLNLWLVLLRLNLCHKQRVVVVTTKVHW